MSQEWENLIDRLEEALERSFSDSSSFFEDSSDECAELSALTYVKQAEDLLIKFLSLQPLPGLPKVLKRLKSEKTFLESIPPCDFVHTSNLVFYDSFYNAIRLFPCTEAIVQRFAFNRNACWNSTNDLPALTTVTDAIEVDIVCFEGSLWIKTRTSGRDKALHRLAQNLLKAASQNLVHYQVPRVAIYFSNGVDELIATSLQHLGIIVMDGKTKLTKRMDGLPFSSMVSIVHLDVSTLLAWVSEVSHTPRVQLSEIIDLNLVHDESLRDQVEKELQTPVLPVIEKVIENRKLVVTQATLDRFRHILKVIGGDNEKMRAENIIIKLEIVAPEMSLRMQNLMKNCNSETKRRNLLTFGTSDHLKIPTVTSNISFLRSCQDKGVHLSAFTHPARALTERKIQFYNSKLS